MRANMHQYSGFKGGNLPFVLGKVAKVALFKPRFVNVDVGAFRRLPLNRLAFVSPCGHSSVISNLYARFFNPAGACGGLQCALIEILGKFMKAFSPVE
jgi:hypothetical protein